MRAPTISTIPAGTIVAYAGANLPDGWLWCNGQVYNSKTSPDYNNLALAIGTHWGSGDGTDGSLNVPDLRGVFLRGVDGNAGRDPDNAASGNNGDDGKRFSVYNGGNSGNAVGSYQRDQFRSHAHGISPNHNFMDNDVNTNSVSGGGGVIYHRQQISILASGGSETRPINAYVNYIIKY